MKKIISLILSLSIILSLSSGMDLTVFATNSESKTEPDEYIYYSDIFYGYSSYLNNNSLREYHNKTYAAMSNVFGEYVDTPAFGWAGFSETLNLFSNMTELAKAYTDEFGLSDFQYTDDLDTANKEFVSNLFKLKLNVSDELSAIGNTASQLDGVISTIEKIFNAKESDTLILSETITLVFSETATYCEYTKSLIPSLNNLVLSYLDNLSDPLDAASEIFEFASALATSIAIEDLRIELIKDIIKTQDSNTILYEGMNRLLSQLTSEYKNYFAETYLTNKIIDKIAKSITKEIQKGAEKFLSKNVISVCSAVQSCVGLINDIVFQWILGDTFSTLKDYRVTMILAQYSDLLYNSVLCKQQEFTKAFTVSQISQYESLCNAFFSATQNALEHCKALAYYNTDYTPLYVNEIIYNWCSYFTYKQYISDVKYTIKNTHESEPKLIDFGTLTINKDTVFSNGSDSIKQSDLYFVKEKLIANLFLENKFFYITVPEQEHFCLYGNITNEKGTYNKRFINNGTLEVMGDISLKSSSSFIMDKKNSILKISGDLLLGNYNEIADGTVIFNGNTLQSVAVYSIKNVIIDNTQGVIFNAPIITGHFEHNGNPLNESTLILQRGATLASGHYDCNFIIRGEVTLSGSITGDIEFDNGTGECKLTVEKGQSLHIDGNVIIDDHNTYGYSKIINDGLISISGNLMNDFLGRIEMSSDAILKIAGNIDSSIHGGTLILNGTKKQTVDSFYTPPTIIIENSCSEGVVFETAISPSVLFNHNNNHFSLYKNGSGSIFNDYDGDGLLDQIDSQPTVAQNVTTYSLLLWTSENASINENCQDILFKFIPAWSDEYSFKTSSNNIETNGYLLDSNMNKIESEHISNNEATYKLKSDETYYYYVTPLNPTDSGDFTINVTKSTDYHATGNLGFAYQHKDNQISTTYQLEGYAGTGTRLYADFSVEDDTETEIAWYSSDPSIVVTDKWNGFLDFISEGTAQITAITENGLVASITVHVKPPISLIESEEVTSAFTNQIPFISYEFVPAETGTYGFSINSNGYIWFKIIDDTSNELIYTSGYDFDSQIYLTANKKYRIYTQSGSGNSQNNIYCIVVKKLAIATSMELSQTSINDFAGKSYGIYSSFGPEGCAYENTTWSISDESIAKISYDPETLGGKYLNIKLLKAGTAIITATSESGLTATCTITVTEPEEILINSTQSGTLSSKKTLVTYKFIPQEYGTYEFQFNDSNHCKNYFYFYLFDDKYDEPILSRGGEYFQEQCFLEKGKNYYLEIRTYDILDEFNADYFINITMPPKATTLKIVCNKESIYPEQSLYLYPQFGPTNSAIENLEWSIEDESIAYINCYYSTGIIELYTFKSGTTTVTATSENGLTASYILTVKSYSDAPELKINEKNTVSTDIDTSIFKFTPIKCGTYAFYSTGSSDTSATLYDSDFNYLISNDESNDGNNFYFSYNLNAGETYYINSYLYNNYGSAPTYDIWVKKLVPATSVRILNGSSYEGYVGNYVSLYAKIYPDNTLKENLVWTVEDESIAFFCDTMSDTRRELYLNNIGTTTVTVTTESGLSDSIEITVKDNSKPEYIKISNGEHINGYIGNSENITVIFYPGGWEEFYLSSDNPDVASVDEYGNVYFDNLGTATITVTTESGLTASCVITVLPTEKIELNKTKKVIIRNPYERVQLNFTPKENGYYTFYSISSKDTHGGINTHLNDDCGTNKNFRTNEYLYAGQTYTLFACFYDSSIGEFDVRLERLDVDTSNGDINFDSEVNSLDLAWMRQLIFNVIPLDNTSSDVYDINVDGSFDVRDLICLKKKIAGIN